jgi:hypothetical protein
VSMRYAASMLVAVVCLLSAPALADSKVPYVHTPSSGDSVRLDGTLGGAKTAWAYVDKKWLDKYLEVTIDAAGADRAYGDTEVQAQLSTIATHVIPIPNGTKASVESVEPFSYGGHQDLEIRVMLVDGPMRGRELWTTCAELVDSAGHSYLRM